MSDFQKLRDEYEAFLRAWEMDADESEQVVTAFSYHYGGGGCVGQCGGFGLARGSDLFEPLAITTTSITMQWSGAYYYLYGMSIDCECIGPFENYPEGVFEASVDGENWTEYPSTTTNMGKHWSAEATGLTPNTHYFFRVTWDLEKLEANIGNKFAQIGAEATTLSGSSDLIYSGFAAMAVGGDEIEVGTCDDYRELILGHVFQEPAIPKPTTLAVALCTTPPTNSHCGWNMPEVADIGGYARQVVSAWSAVSNGMVTNSSDITFGPATAPWGVIRNFAVMDASAHGTGSILFVGSFNKEKYIQTRDKIVIPAGSISLSVS